MKVLVVGGGGREHAIAWSLARFNHEVLCAPGNAGIGRLGRCFDVAAEDVRGLLDLAESECVDLTVVGPEAPLVAGIGDEFRRRGLALFGPDKAGARIEGNKAFAKRLMQEHGIPTARHAEFSEFHEARAHLFEVPVVVKASGLAAGKGVVVARTRDEAEQALHAMMVEGSLGEAGRTVVIEECLDGEEVSVIGLTDGKVVRYLRPSQDHKRLRDGDEGPNTGGMGAYAPAPVVTSEMERQIHEQVFVPLLAGLRRMGVEYRGVIYAGLMLTSEGVKVLEFNCRFGDPETQAILPLLETDLAGLAMACVEGRLAEMRLEHSSRWALCVVAASDGYPGAYRKGLEITGDLDGSDDAIVFHAGTKLVHDKIVTNGGRVLAATGLGMSLAGARDRAYEAVSHIRFEGMFYRRDIGARGLARMATGS